VSCSFVHTKKRSLTGFHLPQISFFFGVMNVLCSALLLGFAPTYIPLYYSVQMAGFLPLRIYAYKKRLYH
jgi:hypothetical protein